MGSMSGNITLNTPYIYVGISDVSNTLEGGAFLMPVTMTIGNVWCYASSTSNTGVVFELVDAAGNFTGAGCYVNSASAGMPSNQGISPVTLQTGNIYSMRITGSNGVSLSDLKWGLGP